MKESKVKDQPVLDTRLANGFLYELNRTTTKSLIGPSLPLVMGGSLQVPEPWMGAVTYLGGVES